MNLCESSTLAFLEKQFQNEFEILPPPIMMSLPNELPEPPLDGWSDDWGSDDWGSDGWATTNSQMPVARFFLPPPVKLAIDTVGYRKSLEAKINSFLKARENDFLFTLMFRRC